MLNFASYHINSGQELKRSYWCILIIAFRYLVASKGAVGSCMSAMSNTIVDFVSSKRVVLFVYLVLPLSLSFHIHSMPNWGLTFWFFYYIFLSQQGVWGVHWLSFSLSWSQLKCSLTFLSGSNCRILWPINRVTLKQWLRSTEKSMTSSFKALSEAGYAVRRNELSEFWVV